MSIKNLKSIIFSLKTIIILVGFFIFSFAYLLKLNNNLLIDEGKVYRVDVEKISHNYESDTLVLDLMVNNPEESIIIPENRNNKIIVGKKDYFYRIDKEEDDLRLTIARKKDIDSEAYLYTSTIRTKGFPKTEYYVEGDKLEDLYWGPSDDLGYLTIEAEIQVLNGAYIVKEIYINKRYYDDYITENYFKLLEE